MLGALAAGTSGGLGARTALAQVVDQNYPSSYLQCDLGAPNNPVWVGWGLGGFGYGGGNNNQGVSGNSGHQYDGLGNLTAVVVNLAELRNTGGPFIGTNSPYARNTGRMDFTPGVNLNYALSGVVHMTLAGASTSNTTAAGSLVLEQIGGPTLATYSGGVFRSGAGGFGAQGFIFDAAAPATGSQTGGLTAGLNYRLSWDFHVSSNMNADQSLSADVTGAAIPSFFQITFSQVPAPGAAGVLGVAGLLATRRRR
jgi:hypothetical protein